MKLFLDKIAIIIGILIILFISVDLFQTHYNNYPQHYKLQYDEIATKKDSFDGIIIGTSHATHSIMPSILDKTGIRFYNFALNGANPIFYSFWFKEVYLKSFKMPKYCIFQIDYFMFHNLSVSRVFEQDAEYFPFKTFLSCLCNVSKYNTKELLMSHPEISKFVNWVRKQHGKVKKVKK